MKKWYVYELINTMGTVEYVGESTNPKTRLRAHKCKNGKFHKRADIILHIVETFDNKVEAFEYQCHLQKEYGFLSDVQKRNKIRIGKKHSVETINKISKSMQGRKLTEQHKKNIGNGVRKN
jgi:predicted GIY-YIG superfamily endonuclease